MRDGTYARLDPPVYVGSRQPQSDNNDTSLAETVRAVQSLVRSYMATDPAEHAIDTVSSALLLPADDEAET